VVALPQNPAGLAAVVILLLGQPSPEQREHLGKATQVVMAVPPLAAAAAVQARRVEMRMDPAIEMAAMEVMALHGAMELPMPEEEVGTQRLIMFLAVAALGEAVEPTPRALQIEAVVAGHSGSLAAPAL